MGRVAPVKGAIFSNDKNFTFKGTTLCIKFNHIKCTMSCMHTYKSVLKLRYYTCTV